MNRLKVNKYQVERHMMSHNNNLESLAKEGSIFIRSDLAKRGLCCDILSKDSSPYVRYWVARNGKFRNVLKYDNNPLVRLGCEF